jgi:glycogen debranching enzyme
VAHPSISVLDGNRFVVSDRHGDLLPESRVPPHGFFADDTRYVSKWRLSVQGRPTDVLATATVDYFVAQFFVVPRSAGFHAAPAITVIRHRMVGDEWLEEILVANHLQEDTPVALDIEVEADFADLFEVKDDEVPRRHITTSMDDRELCFGYRNGDFVRQTQIAFSEPATYADGVLSLRLALGPQEERRINFRIVPHCRQSRPPVVDHHSGGSFEQQREQRRVALRGWLAAMPTLETDDDTLRHVYDQSLIDLASLRFYPHLAEDDVALPAAGLPWFMTLFGRDSLITSYQTLPYRPDLTRTTLRTLAARQGTEVDSFRDMEPGKILHEIRFGELTATGRAPHSPYYGTADATPLFVVLLDEYTRWTGDAGLARELEPHARAALEWIDAHGDADGDGYVEYATRNPTSGLVNQCWKDSWNSMVFADGRIAEGPIASCEVQGYVYDAKRRGARLAREYWGDEQLAARLEEQADELRRRFRDDFWIPERGFYALALDSRKQRVDSLTSNIGHLLWSGIVDEDRAEALAGHLMGDALFSGWGVRTMAAGECGFNPVEYHNGTVWPHDNSLIAAGLRRYGFAAEAARIAGVIVEAARYFEYRLPEVFAGFARSMTHAPVEFPTASRPQAWAAAAPLLFLTTVLGLTPGDDGPRCDPHLPATIGRIALRGLPGAWGTADVSAGAPEPSLVP